MKTLAMLAAVTLAAISATRADLTIDQTIQGVQPVQQVTMKIKGDKARIDSGQQVTTLVDSGNGEIVTLMNDEKRFTRISGERMKAMAQMATQFSGVQKSSEQPKLTPTGKKETINGVETEEYTFETPQLKASYWIAKNYPDGANILKQLQSLTLQSFGGSSSGIPDYRQLPGLPLRTRMTIGDRDIVTNVRSIKQDPLPDALFAIPAGYQEVKLPDFPGVNSTTSPPAQPSPKP